MRTSEAIEGMVATACVPSSSMRRYEQRAGRAIRATTVLVSSSGVPGSSRVAMTSMPVSVQS